MDGRCCNWGCDVTHNVSKRTATEEGKAGLIDLTLFRGEVIPISIPKSSLMTN